MEDIHAHEHTLPDGTKITHTHSHTQTKNVINRMARIIGHMESVKKMVENGRDCSEVLVQLSAIDAAVRSVSRVILKDHIEHCIVDAAKADDNSTIEELCKVVDSMLK